MACYIIPAVAAIAHHIMRKKIPSWQDNERQFWLTLLLSGGAIFGIVDHLWNRELFLIGKNPAYDILLGLTITLAIMAAWAAIVLLDKAQVKNPAESGS